MPFQKFFFALTFTIFSLSAITAAEHNKPFTANNCKPLIQLNQSMKESLQLTVSEMKALREINRIYWSSRKQLLDTPKMIGRNTALLACWDKWRLSLEKSLTEAQMNQFMQWQSQVDLLGETPF